MTDETSDAPPRVEGAGDPPPEPADAPAAGTDQSPTPAGEGDGASREETDDGPANTTGSGDVEAYTTDVRTLDPRVRWLWVVRGLVFALVLGGATTGITLAVAPGLTLLGPAVTLALIVLGTVHAVLLYRSWEFRVRDDSMYLHRGVVTRVQTVVPYVRVQHIDTSRGPIERAVGLSSLVVYTAGSRGADVTVPGLTPEEASDLQTRLKALAIESEGEDAV